MPSPEDFDLNKKRFEFAKLKAHNPNITHAEAVNEAGYNPSSKASASAMGSEFMNDERVQNAIKAMQEPRKTIGEAKLVAMLDKAVGTLEKLMDDEHADIQNPENKRKTALDVLDRVGITPKEKDQTDTEINISTGAQKELQESMNKLQEMKEEESDE